MGLNAALQVGRSGLLTSQAALQVTGNNLANMGTVGYHRQTVSLAPAGSSRIGQHAFVGRGVQLQAITRQVNEALEARLRGSIADQSGSLARHDLLTQIEALHNELSGADLSTHLGAFFNSWSQLANNPQDLSLRTLVVEEGANLANFVQTLRGGLTTMRGQIDKSAENAVTDVNNLLTKIEEVNQRIALSGGGVGGAAGLKDQRDALLGELSQYLDISTVTQDNGVTDVFVGSLPIILSGQSRGVELRTRTIDGVLEIDVVLADDKSPLDLSSGRLGTLINFRKGGMQEAIDTLDRFAHELVWQVNRVHSGGQGLHGFDQVTGSYQVLDPTAALSDPAAGLDFAPGHGSFQVHVTQKSTGQRVSTTINVDLDGINPATDTTLVSLVGDIDGVANLSAVVTVDGRLRITAGGADFEVSFSDDSSGALSALGVNTFFTGGDAMDIAVNPVVSAQPQHLAASAEHLPGDNQTALALAALRDEPAESLGGLSLTGFWTRHVEDFAIRTAQADQQVQADTIVRENLQQQQQQLSGVNPDEEAINLIQFQRAYQSSARFISVVDELMATLLNMV